MESSRIKILVDKYFDGLTSLEEEQELARYFAETDDIPEEYQGVKMMLVSFDTLRQETSKVEIVTPVETRRNRVFTLNRKWIAGVAVAASVLIGVVVTLNLSDKQLGASTTVDPGYVCYVNGVKIDDDQQAYAEANRILGNLSEDMQLAMAEVNRLTHYTIVK